MTHLPVPLVQVPVQRAQPDAVQAAILFARQLARSIADHQLLDFLTIATTTNRYSRLCVHTQSPSQPKPFLQVRLPLRILLGELFGADIALYPAHLATLNLAAREINDEANYPRIARTDFFDITPDRPFCQLPLGRDHARTTVPLPALDAIVGNPPYVRQEKLSQSEKQKCADRVREAFPGIELRGRADLHCYFWPHSTRFLKEGGYFGFLTSGQWLDVDYGFALQRWILLNFRIVAIMESATERWFPDARVKTCITILQRCSDEVQRRRNRVRFVRFEKPLADLINVQPSSGVGKDADHAEKLRQHAVDLVRNAIENVNEPVHDDRWRILLRDQEHLWEEGVRSGQTLKKAPAAAEDIAEDEEEDVPAEQVDSESDTPSWIVGRDYVAGKWGRYLRAPDFYFEVMQRFRDSFTPLGQIVDLRFGVKTGCDAFFMPRDVSKELLTRTEDAKEFRKLTGVARERVASGELKIVRDGANTVHPIESIYLKPEVHSLIQCAANLVVQGEVKSAPAKPGWFRLVFAFGARYSCGG